MATAYDTSTGSNGTGITSLSWSHTCSGSSRGLVVGVSNYPLRTMAVTYNSVSMASEGSQSDTGGDPGEIEQFSLIAPASGANTVSVTWGGSSTDVSASSVSFTGANQTDLCGTQAKNNGNSSAPTTTVSSASGEIVIDGLTWYPGVTAITASVGSGQTQRWNQASGDNIGGGVSTEAGATSVVMSWTLSDGTDWGITGISVKAAAGITGTSATTNAADTSTASGGIYATGTSTTTNAADTSSASGAITVTGTSTTTNAGDTSAASGGIYATGTSTTTNAADTSAASGGIYATGTSATTNAADTSSADGTVSGGTVTGTIAVTNANDTSSASGTVPVTVVSGGHGRAGRKRRFRVEIGDQVFYVWSEAEAQAILDAFAVTADVPEVTRSKKTRFNVVVAEAVDQTAREIKANTRAQQKREEIEEENLLIILKALNS